MMHLIRRVATRVGISWRVITRGSHVASEMHDEMRFHVEMETERLMREQGLSSNEARRRALVSFVGVEKHKWRRSARHGGRCEFKRSRRCERMLE